MPFTDDAKCTSLSIIIIETFGTVVDNNSEATSLLIIISEGK